MKNAVDEPVRFKCGLEMKNKFMLAPLTNTQSHEDGRLSEDEFRWLTMRAQGQFGLVMTCASHVQKQGKGFPGQLGIFSDALMEGHQKLTHKIKSYGSLAVIQLHHAGMRSTKELIHETPVCPSNIEKHGARAMTQEEVEALKKDFIDAALRAQKCGYNGVEIHGAHGYILAQFLSPEINLRTDKYGGSLENRARLLMDIVRGIRSICGEEFLMGVRLSPERFGLKLNEIKLLSERLANEGMVDFLDVSCWDIHKLPEEEEHQHQTLLQHFTELELKDMRLTVAGKIRNGYDVKEALNSGVDFVTIGRSAILHHDFPLRVMKNPNFQFTATPVSIDYLRNEGLGERFITYMNNWPNFVKQ